MAHSVKMCGRFVKDNEVGIVHKGACQGESLALSKRQSCPTHTNARFPSLGKLSNHPIKTGLTAGQVIAPDMVEGSLNVAAHQLTGGFFSLLTPYTILGGLTVLAVCLAHGAQFLALKTEGEVRERANGLAAPLTILATLLAASFLLWGQFAYTTNILAWIPLLVAALAIIASAALSQKALRREGLSFVFSILAIAATVSWIFAAMAPNVMKSSIDPAYSLTIAQASSSQPTLTVMTIVALCFVPVVLAYTAWSYWVFRKRVSVKDVDHNTGLLPRQIRLGENFLAG